MHKRQVDGTVVPRVDRTSSGMRLVGLILDRVSSVSYLQK